MIVAKKESLSLVILMGLTLCLLRAEEPIQQSLRLHLQNAPVAAVAELINELTESNIAVSSGASDNLVSLDLRRTSVDMAVETMARNAGIWYRRDPSGVLRLLTRAELDDDWVQVQDAQLRTFAIAYPSARSVAEQIAQLYGERVFIASIRDRQVWTGASSDAVPSSGSSPSGSEQEGGMQPQRQATVQEQIIRLTVDEGSNRLLLRTSDTHAMDEIADLIQTLDEPIMQVLLEIKILEVELRDGQETAIGFTFDDSLSPSTDIPIVGAEDILGEIGENPILDFLGNNEVQRILGGSGGANSFVDTTPGGVVYAFVDRHIQARLRALREEGRVSSLGSPLILSLNNRQSEIDIGESRPIVSGAQIVSVETGRDANNNPTTTQVQAPVYSDQLIGTRLQVRPLINKDRTLTLEIVQETTSLNDASATLRLLSGTELVSVAIDTVTTARIEGTVMARDGHTLIMGGLVRQSLAQIDRKVPILGSLPLLGFFFRSRENRAERSELVLLFTPHIINTHKGEGEGLREQRLRALSRHPWVELGDDSLDVFGPDEAPRRQSSSWFQEHLEPHPGALP